MPGTARVVVITGAGSGTGRDIAIAMLRAGHRVALAGRGEAALHATARAAAPGPAASGTGASGEALVVPADVRSAESVGALFTAVAARWGRVDVLVNNAGTFGHGGPLDVVPLEQWNAVIETNLTGSFLCAQHAFRMMKEQDPRGGRIINNGSVSAHVPRRNSTPYVATKHALTGLTRSLSLDGRGLDIACGQIDIGNAATERNTDTSVGRLQATGKVEAEARIDVRHVANGVRYMASLPLDANVQFMTVMATKMPYIGRG